jgi:ferric-dicitrate binding protein FerR (iron transport regulator)
MTDDAERALHERFRALRNHAEAGAPEFRDTLDRLAQRRPRTVRRRRTLGAITVVAAAALVLFVVVRTGGKRPGFVDLAATSWEGPTDFLLRTPGAELLRTIPTFTAAGRLLP